MNIGHWLKQLRSVTTTAFSYIIGWDDTRKEWRRMSWDTLVSLLSGEIGGGGPTDVDTLSVDYTITSAGEQVLQVTAPTEGVYLLEAMLQGVADLGTADALDGNPVAYMIGDLAEGPLGASSVFLKTINAVDGIRIYKRSDTPAYLTGNDIPIWDVLGRYAYSYGTGLAFYQRQMVYLKAAGTVEFYIKDDNTNGEAVNGYRNLLAGSKIQITKVADFSSPEIVAV